MTASAILVAGCLATYAFVVVTAILWLRRARHRLDREADGFTPPISILKPLKGVDEGLEENLESFFRLDYPDYQLILAIADEDDPAVEVARRVRGRHPDADAEIVVGAEVIGRNPKVNLLQAMLPRARHELCLISDSNVRAHAAYLRRTVAGMRDPEIGVVSNPVIGVGEQTAAAAMENLHLSGFIACVNIAAKAVAGIDAVVGKSMLIRKQALADIGGLRAVRNVLAEDQLIAQKMLLAGWRARLVGEPVHNVNERWSVRRLIERHSRWARIRIRLVPWSYPLEIVVNPVAVAVLLALFGASDPVWLVLGAAAGKTALDVLASWGVRGELPAKGWVFLTPLKDLLMLGIWFVPFWSSRVEWRGNSLRVTKGTRLVSPEAYHRAKAIARAGRHGHGDEHTPMDAAA